MLIWIKLHGSLGRYFLFAYKSLTYKSASLLLKAKHLYRKKRSHFNVAYIQMSGSTIVHWGSNGTKHKLLIDRVPNKHQWFPYSCNRSEARQCAKHNSDSDGENGSRWLLSQMMFGMFSSHSRMLGFEY